MAGAVNARRRDPAYCFGVMGRAKAPWRPTAQEARVDAVEAGFGWWSDYARPPGTPGMIYLHPLAEIWTTHELVPAIPRPVDPPSMPARTIVDDQDGITRIDRIIARREARRS